MGMWQSDHRRLYYWSVTVLSQRAIIVYGKCDSSFREGYTMDMWQSYHRRPYCHSVELWQSDHRRTCYEKSISLLPEKASFAMKTYSCQITECVRFQKVQYIQITQEYQMKIDLCIFIYSYRIKSMKPSRKKENNRNLYSLPAWQLKILLTYCTMQTNLYSF